MIENVTYCDKHVSSWKCLFFVVSHVAAKIYHKTKVSHRLIEIKVTVIILIIIYMFNIVL